MKFNLRISGDTLGKGSGLYYMIDQLCLIYDLPDCYTALEVLFYGKRFPGPHTVSALNLKRFVELTE